MQIAAAVKALDPDHVCVKYWKNDVDCQAPVAKMMSEATSDGNQASDVAGEEGIECDDGPSLGGHLDSKLAAWRLMVLDDKEGFDPQDGGGFSPQNGHEVEPDNREDFDPRNGEVIDPLDGHEMESDNREGFHPRDRERFEPQGGQEKGPDDGKGIDSRHGERVDPQRRQDMHPDDGEGIEPKDRESLDPQGENMVPDDVEGVDLRDGTSVDPQEGQNIEPDEAMSLESWDGEGFDPQGGQNVESDDGKSCLRDKERFYPQEGQDKEPDNEVGCLPKGSDIAIIGNSNRQQIWRPDLKRKRGEAFYKMTALVRQGETFDWSSTRRRQTILVSETQYIFLKLNALATNIVLGSFTIPNMDNLLK
jgi:hypothetical protein